MHYIYGTIIFWNYFWSLIVHNVRERLPAELSWIHEKNKLSDNRYSIIRESTYLKTKGITDHFVNCFRQRAIIKT